MFIRSSLWRVAVSACFCVAISALMSFCASLSLCVAVFFLVCGCGCRAASVVTVGCVFGDAVFCIDAKGAAGLLLQLCSTKFYQFFRRRRPRARQLSHRGATTIIFTYDYYLLPVLAYYYYCFLFLFGFHLK